MQTRRVFKLHFKPVSKTKVNIPHMMVVLVAGGGPGGGGGEGVEIEREKGGGYI